jgi:hypothetical protein
MTVVVATATELDAGACDAGDAGAAEVVVTACCATDDVVVGAVLVVGAALDVGAVVVTEDVAGAADGDVLTAWVDVAVSDVVGGVSDTGVSDVGGVSDVVGVSELVGASELLEVSDVVADVLVSVTDVVVVVSGGTSSSVTPGGGSTGGAPGSTGGKVAAGSRVPTLTLSSFHC